MFNIAIITPIYYPAPGGAAVYTRQLAEGLARRDEVAKVRIYTEACPGEPVWSESPGRKVEVHRCFPWRAGRPEVDLKSYVAYVRQNINFARLGSLIPEDVNALIVHSSLHYKPNLLDYGIGRMRTRRGRSLKLILDVRDRLIPPSKIGVAEQYDEVICCSQNVLSHMSGLSDRLSLNHIPVIHDPPARPDPISVQRVEQKYGLSGVRYALATNGIEVTQGIDETIACVRELRSEGDDIYLAVAGKRRSWAARHEAAVKEGLLRYLGAVPPNELSCLMAAAEIHLNVSPIEGLPRASLEAIGIGTRVVLPPNVPEFGQHCAAYVADNLEPSALAALTKRVLSEPKRGPAYPMQDHSSEMTIPRYLKLIAQPGST